MVPLRSISIFTFGFLLLFLCSSLAEQQQFAVDGKVLELDESNFEAAISTFDYMFVDFYAPWCGHCKRLSPELDKASVNLAVLKQPVVIAKVDADKYSRLASKYEIDGFPTLKIFMHGVPTDYYGPRKADLLVRFLKKFVAPDVSVLNSDSAISEFIEEAGKNFPIFIGFGLNESVISHLAVKYKKSAWFSVAKDFSDKTMEFYDFDKVPALVALHLTYNEQSIFYGPFEEKFLEDYIKQSLLPLVLPINQDTLKALKDDKRKIVLTIVEDEDDERSKGLVKLLKAAASANRDLVFAFVGFEQWQDFAESFEVSKKIKLPKMIVWDGDVEYFSVIGSDSVEDEDQGSQITRFLKGYREGSVIQKHIISDDYKAFRNSMFLIGALILVLVVILVSMMMQSVKEEPSREQVDHSTSLSEAREALRSGDKQDKID
ncbi:protein disulfide-isomerase 5-2-like [Solanum verrucosum]|uniref:protein disulfide-isomerase 5-2-like n=1 Tax=Solanum verrucosum TaxID=315347 RepID=UPI0020D06DE6|nr:protein disulfide-isomerase 5-2-like [Solanum verrucosum]